MKLKTSVAIVALLVGCMANRGQEKPKIPALEYAERVRGPQRSAAPQAGFASYAAGTAASRAQLRLAKNDEPRLPRAAMDDRELLSNEPGGDDVFIYESQAPNVRDYNGPLSLGDPGLSSSLWQESRRGNELFRDDRAWQPMDLITIVVTEKSEGKKEADTEGTEESTVSAAISNLLGYENDVTQSNPGISLENLINATTTNDFKGEGDTERKGSLKATISAVVVEVLPGGVLRIEGEKIISVNSEEQVMIISGLIRPRDVSSSNEVDSSKVANMRVDYYGRGIVGEAQNGGWLSRFMRYVWPF